MVSDDPFHLQEKRRRRAIWTLAHPRPGDPRALCVLRVLDEIDQQEQTSMSAKRILTLNEVANEVASEPHPVGLSIVRDDAIPEPWRDSCVPATVLPV